MLGITVPEQGFSSQGLFKCLSEFVSVLQPIFSASLGGRSGTWRNVASYQGQQRLVAAGPSIKRGSAITFDGRRRQHVNKAQGGTRWMFLAW
jgi:hypothetical protein